MGMVVTGIIREISKSVPEAQDKGGRSADQKQYLYLLQTVLVRFLGVKC